MVQPVLLVGGPGTAKTNITKQFLGGFNLDQATAKTIMFSSLTSPGIFQATLEVERISFCIAACLVKYVSVAATPSILWLTFCLLVKSIALTTPSLSYEVKFLEAPGMQDMFGLI